MSNFQVYPRKVYKETIDVLPSLKRLPRKADVSIFPPQPESGTLYDLRKQPGEEMEEIHPVAEGILVKLYDNMIGRINSGLATLSDIEDYPGLIHKAYLGIKGRVPSGDRKKVLDMVKNMLSNLEDIIYNMKQNPQKVYNETIDVMPSLKRPSRKPDVEILPMENNITYNVKNRGDDMEEIHPVAEGILVKLYDNMIGRINSGLATLSDIENYPGLIHQAYLGIKGRVYSGDRKKVIDMVKTMLSNLEDVIYNMKKNPHLQHRIEGGPFLLKKADTQREPLKYIKHTPKSIPIAPLVVPKYQSKKELSMPFELSDEPVTYLEEPTILEDEDIFKPVTKAKGKSRMKIHEVKATGKIVDGPGAKPRKSSKSKKSEPAPSSSMDIPSNLSKLTVVALKDLMRSRGIKPMTGRKADLIARIESHTGAQQPKSRAPTPVASPPKKARTPPIKMSTTPKAFQDLQLEEFV